MRSWFVAAAVLSLTACVEDVGKGKVKAEVADVPVTEVAPKANPVAGTSLAVDPARSSIGALGAKVTATHPVTWETWTGSVTVDGETLTGVAFEADMASMKADHPKLTAHLQDEDFFHVASFPKATFQSVAIAPGSKAEGDWTHTVTGDFTIRGATKRITFPAHVTIGDDGVQARSEFVINRQDFGVAYPGAPDNLVQDNVRMSVSFVAPRG